MYIKLRHICIFRGLYGRAHVDGTCRNSNSRCSDAACGNLQRAVAIEAMRLETQGGGVRFSADSTWWVALTAFIW